METSFCQEILTSFDAGLTWQIECGFNRKYYHIQDIKQSKIKYCLGHRMCKPIQQGWPDLHNVRATYDTLQMFESHKT
jgi:hypothetical protein